MSILWSFDVVKSLGHNIVELFTSQPLLLQLHGKAHSCQFYAGNLLHSEFIEFIKFGCHFYINIIPDLFYYASKLFVIKQFPG